MPTSTQKLNLVTTNRINRLTIVSRIKQLSIALIIHSGKAVLVRKIEI